MRNLVPSLRTGLAASLLLASVPFAHAADDTSTEIQALRDQIRQLDQAVKILERKQELKDQDIAAAAKDTPKVTYDGQGFRLSSGDGASFLHVGGLVQADSRWYFSQNKGITNDDAFLIRRARIILDGQFNKNTTFLLVRILEELHRHYLTLT